MPLMWKIEGCSDDLVKVFSLREDWKDWWEVFSWDPKDPAIWKYKFFDNENDARVAHQILNGWIIAPPMNVRVCEREAYEHTIGVGDNDYPGCEGDQSG